MSKEFNALEFKMKFRAYFATLAFVSVIGLIVLLIFKPESAKDDTIQMVLTFMLGTLMGSIITFYFDGNEHKDSHEPPVLPETSKGIPEKNNN